MTARDHHTGTPDAAAAYERHRAQSEGDYCDPRDNYPDARDLALDDAEAAHERDRRIERATS